MNTGRQFANPTRTSGVTPCGAIPECPHCGGPVSVDTSGRAGSHRVWRIGSDGLSGPSRDRREAFCPGAGQLAVLAPGVDARVAA